MGKERFGVLQIKAVDSLELYYCFLPVRDVVNHIEKVMDSLIDQSVKPSKIIVVDDGSTDGTSEILLKYKNKYNNLVQIIRTENKTRDYKRLSELWNMCLLKDYKYHMIGAGDVSFEKDYAKKILERMEANEDIVIASGDFVPFRSQSPHGGGRFVRQDFFYDTFKDGKYSLIIGYESEILVRAMMKYKKTRIYNDIIFDHLDTLGHNHNFSEFGYSMRTLGYHPLWCLARCLIDINVLGWRGSFNMFKSYIMFKPDKTGYYSMFDPEIRRFMHNYQSITFRLMILNWIINLLFFRKKMPIKLKNKLKKMAYDYKKRNLNKYGIFIDDYQDLKNV